MFDLDNQAMTPESLKGDPRWQAVERVISSQSFAKAARLVGFLRYVCERTLLGRSAEISEQQVGIYVFGRPPDYDPATDNIVRGTARQLRQRWAVFYQEEGREESIRIAIPRGAYIPVFECMSATQRPLDSQVASDTAEPPAIANRSEVRAAPLSKLGIGPGWLIVAVVAAVLAGLTLWSTRPRPVDQFWRLIFSKDHKTLLIPGDSGVVMFQNLTGKTVHLEEYAAGTYRTNAFSKSVDPPMLDNLGDRRYTSFSDLKFAARLVQRPQVIPDRFEIRYARDIRVEDLKQANAILVGSPQGNPWAEMFYRDLNFSISSDEKARTLTVVNRAPRAGERSDYTYSHYDPLQRAYATIALTDNLDHSGKVLLVGGTTVAGIDAGADFLFNDVLMQPIVEEWIRTGGTGSRFELLLETSGIAANGSSVKLIAKHFGKP